MKTFELDDLTHEQIKALCQLGDEHLEGGDFTAAIGQYNLAWELIPEPKNNWEAATWVLAAIGDAL